MKDDILRDQLIRFLNFKEAHVGFDGAFKGIPEALRGAQPEGLPYSPWQLLEHLRIAQYDILDFCRNPDYEEMSWPDDYWPKSAAPGKPEDWEESLRRFRADRETLKKLAADESLDLTEEIPHGDGQTYLRELLLVADHNAYHIGQVVVVRRLLGIWPPG